MREYVSAHLACEAVVVSAQIESDLVDLEPEEAAAYLKELGVDESGKGRSVAPRTGSSGCRPTSRPARRKCAPGRSGSVTRRRRPPVSSTPISNAVSSSQRPTWTGMRKPSVRVFARSIHVVCVK